MKTISNLIALITFIAAVYLIYINYGQEIPFNLLGTEYAIDMAIIMLSFFVLGDAFSFFINVSRNIDNENKIKVYKRELEKNSVECSSNYSKVDVLEAKIKVLEKALEDALNR